MACCSVTAQSGDAHLLCLRVSVGQAFNTGHSEDKLSQFGHVWASAGNHQTPGARIIARLVNSVSGCYWLGAQLGRSAGRPSHAQAATSWCCRPSHTWWLGPKYKRGRRTERERSKGYVALDNKPHQPHSVLSLVEAVSPPAFRRREHRAHLWMDMLVHVTSRACGVGRVLVWPSRENIICHRVGVSGKHVERRALGNTLHYCFVTFGPCLLVIGHGHRCGQKSKTCIDRESSCAWSVSKNFSLVRLAILSWCSRPTKELGSSSHVYRRGVAISPATPFLCFPRDRARAC